LYLKSREVGEHQLPTRSAQMVRGGLRELYLNSSLGREKHVKCFCIERDIGGIWSTPEMSGYGSDYGSDCGSDYDLNYGSDCISYGSHNGFCHAKGYLSM